MNAISIVSFKWVDKSNKPSGGGKTAGEKE